MSERFILVLSGPSGVGKSSICKHLLSRPDCVMSVSATTRAPRGQEQEGVAYHFLSEEEFRARIAAGDFLEWAEVFSQSTLYGTLKRTVDDHLAAGSHVLLDIDVQGVAKLRDIPDLPLKTIFIEPPSIEILKQRLVGRGDTAPEEIERRLNTARGELEQAPLYDHRIVNDDLDRAVAEVFAILDA